MHCRQDEHGVDLNREKGHRTEDTRRSAIMPSAHYETIAACLQENIELLSDAFGEVRPENQPVWNISNAVLALSDAL